MPKFIATITVEADQYREADVPPLISVCHCQDFVGRHVHTARGIVPIADGEWIVRDEFGAKWVCSDAEFTRDYKEEK